jgi:hypothetical protein
MKPADFYVGVIDLFAILLPGAGMAWAVWRFPGMSAVLAPLLAPNPQGNWIAFAVAAFVFGQLLFAVSSSRLDEKWDKQRSSDPSIAADPARQMARALREAMFGLPPNISDEERRRWTEIMLDRAGVPRRIFGFLNDMRPGEKHILRDAYQFAQAVLRIWTPAALIEVERLQAASKFFRSLYYMLPVIALSLLANAVWQLVELPGLWPLATTLFAVMVAAALLMLMPACKNRFSELRNKANDELYRALAVALALRSAQAANGTTAKNETSNKP